jgi:hypothetical protein
MTFMSAALPVVVFMTWPQSEHVLELTAVAAISWAYLVSVRTLSVRRSDESIWFRIGSLLLFPTAILWTAFVLRPLRLYGMATCLKQRWTTRQTGPEGMKVPARTPAPEPAPRLPEPDVVLS